MVFIAESEVVKYVEIIEWFLLEVGLLWVNL